MSSPSNASGSLRSLSLEPSPSSRCKGDTELVAAAQAGAEPAIERFLQRMLCVPRILTATNLQLGSPLVDSELEDVVSHALLDIWRALGSYNGTTSLEAWACPFCFSSFLGHLRRSKRRPRRTEGAEDAWGEHLRLEGALRDLDAMEADLLRLKHASGLSFDELGPQMSVSPNSLRSRYHHGMRALHAALGQQRPAHWDA